MILKLNLFKDKNSIELARKLIHVGSIILPIYYRYYLNSNDRIMISVLLLMVGVSILVELLRLEKPGFNKFFNFIFGIMLRKHEKSNFTGASYLLTSYIVCIAFFSDDIAFLAMCFLSIGDTFAALVGMNFGKRNFINSKKSLEGFIACFVSTFAFGIAIINIHPVIPFLGAIAASCAEAINIPIDDNVKIPIWSGIVMTVTYLFIG